VLQTRIIELVWEMEIGDAMFNRRRTGAEVEVLGRLEDFLDVAPPLDIGTVLSLHGNLANSFCDGKFAIALQFRRTHTL
jgi:hypothetical protein